MHITAARNIPNVWLYSQAVRPVLNPKHPLLQAQQYDIAGHFPLPLGLQTTFRNKLSEYVFFFNSVRRLQPEQQLRPNTEFLENDKIVFHLAAMSQCEQGGKGHI